MSHTSRRTFLKASGAAAVAASLDPRFLHAAPIDKPLGTQLYSVRDLLPTDFDGTLKKLSGAGYKVVEAAGYFNKTAAQ